MSKGFIKNTRLLDETPRVPDSMDWSNLKNIIEKKIKSISKSSILAIVGPFGIGKSTMLDKIEKDIKSDKNFWFNFEAWKYPERENLWENFIYDFAQTSGVITKKDIEDITHGELRGGKKIIKSIIKTLTSMAKVDYIGTLFTEDLKESPVTRVNDYQKLLDTIIIKLNKPIFITIEDIDRSGDFGLFFLETLKNYLEKKTSKKKILFFVPISTKNYNEEIDRYLKVIDYFEFFNPSYNKNFLGFVEDFLCDELKTTDNHLLLADFISEYVNQYPDTTLRKLKLILRQANIVYMNQRKDGKNPDWRLTLCAEMMKFVPIKPDSNESFYESVTKTKGISENNIFSAYIEGIRVGYHQLREDDGNLRQPMYPIITILKNPNEAKDPYIAVPWIGNGKEPLTQNIYVEDFYFRYN